MGQRTFTITRPEGSVKPDAFGKAKIPFTVTNVSGRSLKSTIEIIPENPADSKILTLEGERERPFSANDTQTVNVMLTGGAKPGDHRFSIKLVPLDYPDDSEEGPGVAFAIAQPDHKKFPWWMVIAAAAVGVCGGLGYYLLSNKKVAVPDCVTKPTTFAQAQQTLQAVGLLAVKADERSDASKSSGAVIAEDHIGDKVPKGTKINFIVNAQQIPVVRVKGLLLEEAKTRLADAGFLIDKAVKQQNQPTDDPTVNRVLAQDPDPDVQHAAMVFASGPITLTVGVQRDQANVTSYFGQSYCDATKQLTAAGFNTNVVWRPGNQPGIVIGQDPSAGQHPKGSTVSLMVSQPVVTCIKFVWNGALRRSNLSVKELMGPRK
jgi:beta-lactam-binding protein with PASTA domain